MCCCNCPAFYKARVWILAFLSIFEAIFGLFRIIIFAAPAISEDGSFNITNIANLTDGIFIAFVFDWSSSIMATTMGISIVLFIALFQCFCCLTCCYAICRNGSSKAKIGYCESLSGLTALHRFVSFDCNCPCYKARPKLRFYLRFFFLILCLILRGGAVYLYWTVSGTDSRARSNFYSCFGSIGFLIIIILLDLYRYGVWWCYTPSMDIRCHCRSEKHKRYMPHHIVSDTQRKDVLGDRPCTSQPCYNRHLSHIVVFHGKDYKPQPRWNKIHRKTHKSTYIGFHTSNPDAIVSIVHSEFLPSKGGMLGKGVYFARSAEDTLMKTQGGNGACIIAEIRMGNVFEFNKDEIYPNKLRDRDQTKYDFVRNSKWQDEYDTCYMNHPEENKDEFCIKDPKRQIIKWIAMVDKNHDSKVEQYGLDTEFDSTKCHCV